MISYSCEAGALAAVVLARYFFLYTSRYHCNYQHCSVNIDKHYLHCKHFDPTVYNRSVRK